MAVKKNKGGRPKKNMDILPENWEEQVLSLYSEGGSDVEVRALIYRMTGSFSTDLFYRWIEEEPKFSETIKRGRELAQSWWHSKGREVENKNLNATLWYMNMKNRYGWADKQEVKQETKHKGKIEINYNVPKPKK